MSQGILVGMLLGIVIGVLSGVVTLALLKTMAGASIKNVASLVPVTTQVLAIPTFMFGGPWATTRLLGEVLKLDELLLPYVTALTIVFVIIVILPMYKWILHLAIEMGESAGNSDE